MYTYIAVICLYKYIFYYEVKALSKGKRILFVAVLITFISLSVFFTFNSIARDTFEFEEQENIGEIEGLNGWVFFGFNGNTSTKTLHLDFVRDQRGENPDESKPIIGIDSFTVVSDEYVEFIYIGKDVRYISDQAFYYCKMLKAVFVDEENESFVSVGGVLYTKDMKTLILHPICNGEWAAEEGLIQNAQEYVIPEGVENIGGYSFYKNENLVQVSIPEGVESIGDMAFFGCSSMKLVTLPNGLVSIGNDAFSYCRSMEPAIYIPATVKEIGHHAFFSCSGLTQFYLQAESEDEFTAGDGWLPKSIKKGIMNVAPEPKFGQTREQMLQAGEGENE